MAPNITIIKVQEKTNTKSTESTSSVNSSIDNIWGERSYFSEGNQDIIDTSSKTKLTQEDQKIYDEIYKKIEEKCKEENIDINLAKEFNLIGKILGKTAKELVEFAKTETGKKEINEAIDILKSHLGFGDGTGFGEKDIADLEKITKDVQNKIGREKVGGSWLGQTWHKAKSFVGINTISKANTPEEIADCYKEAYLENIDKLSTEELKERYSDMLTEFYYDFNSLSDNPEKQVAMTKAIALLASDHRDLIIEIMSTQFKDNPKALEAFGKALNINFKDITTTSDELGNTVNQDQATKISNISYSIMSEEDVKVALETLKKDATKFYEEYGEKIEELKARRESGEALSEAEIKLLTEAENVYEGQYAGAYTGIYNNNGIAETDQIKLMSQINNDTQEIGIQEEVFDAINNFIDENPDKLENSREKFEELMNEATNNEYSNHNNNNKSNTPTISNNNENNNPQVDSNNNTNTNTQNSNPTNKTSEKASEVDESSFIVKNTGNTNTSSKTTSIATESTNTIIEAETKTEKENVNEEKEVIINNTKDFISTVKEGGVKAFYEILSEGNETAIVADALNNKTLVGNDILNVAKNIYKNSKSSQINILERLSSTGVYIVDDLTTISTWNKAANKTFRSFELSSLIHEKAEKSIEEAKA